MCLRVCVTRPLGRLLATSHASLLTQLQRPGREPSSQNYHHACLTRGQCPWRQPDGWQQQMSVVLRPPPMSAEALLCWEHVWPWFPALFSWPCPSLTHSTYFERQSVSIGKYLLTSPNVSLTSVPIPLWSRRHWKAIILPVKCIFATLVAFLPLNNIKHSHNFFYVLCSYLISIFEINWQLPITLYFSISKW